MRNYGIPQILDLVSDGGTAVSLTPGTAPVSAEFIVSAPRAGVGDNWPLALNYVTRFRVTVDQAASGGTAMNWDELACVADSFDIKSPVLGNTHPRDTFQGTIAKHLVEFVSMGYNYADGGRTQIASTDGDTTMDVYFILPHAHECGGRPHHFAPWLGWLQNTKIANYLAAANVLDGLSTGAVIKAPCTVQTWIEYVVSDELIMPSINQWHLYETPATGGTTAILNGLGTANGYNDLLDGSRIAGLYELTGAQGNAKNIMGGSATADQYTSYTIPQFSQDVTVNVDAFFSAYRRIIGGHRGPISNAVGVATHDSKSGNPFQMRGGQGTSTGDLMNTANALFIPIRSPGHDMMLTKLMKFFGDLKITRTFSSTPSSGKFRFVTNELRELGAAKKTELIGKTGRPGKLEPIWGSGSKGSADNARHPRRQAVFPERVVFS